MREPQRAPIPETEAHIFADAFNFDAYCHLRLDIVGPETGLDRALPALVDIQVRPGVDWMLAGLPQMCTAPLAAVANRPVQLELTGVGGL